MGRLEDLGLRQPEDRGHVGLQMRCRGGRRAADHRGLGPARRGEAHRLAAARGVGEGGNGAPAGVEGSRVVKREAHRALQHPGGLWVCDDDAEVPEKRVHQRRPALRGRQLGGVGRVDDVDDALHGHRGGLVHGAASGRARGLRGRQRLRGHRGGPAPGQRRAQQSRPGDAADVASVPHVVSTCAGSRRFPLTTAWGSRPPGGAAVPCGPGRRRSRSGCRRCRSRDGRAR